MSPQKVIDIPRPDGGAVRVSIYSMGLVIERAGDSRAFIHGVEVPEWLVVKSPGEIEPRELFRIAKPEVRDRFIRKLGIRRVMSALGGRVLSRQREERLISFDDDGRRRVYLLTHGWMSQWRLEYVDQAIKTVTEAHQWKQRIEAEKDRRERAWRGLRS